MGVIVSPFAYLLGGGQGTAPSTGGPDGTQYYVEVTIASSQVASTLTDFPVYVDLNDLPAAFWTNVQTDGGYYDGGGSTLSQPGVATTYGRNAVWSDYEGVWHMEQDPSGSAPQMVDSTGNNDGTSAGSMTSGDSVTAKLGGGLDFDGTNDRIETGLVAPSGSSNRVTQAWVNLDTTAGGLNDRDTILSYGDAATMEAWRLRQEDGTTGEGSLRVEFDSTARTATTRIDTQTWKLVHAVLDGTSVHDVDIYIDGSSDTISNAGTDSTISTGTGTGLTIGQDRTADVSGRYLDGKIDEVRVRGSALTADWISAEYTNQNSTTTFYTIGSQTAA